MHSRAREATREPLDTQKISYKGPYDSKWIGTLISWILPLVFFILIWRFLISRMRGGPQGMLSVGRAKTKIYAEREVGVTFDDVAGIDDAKHELDEIVLSVNSGDPDMAASP